MNKFKKWLIPIAVVCLLLASLIGCSEAPQSLGQILDPSGNPFANRFTDVKDIRTATYVVAASDSEHKYEADYFCSGTNDHMQIQAAIDALPATGGEVKLLDGTYNLAVTLTMDSYQTLSGCGRNTILTSAINIDVITAIGGAGTEKAGILMTDLCIFGGGVVDICILWTYVDESRITNTWLDNFDEDAIKFNNCDYNEIANNIITEAENSAIELTDSTHNSITGNSCLISDFNEGIYLITSDNNTVTGNTCQGNGDNGIYVYESDNNTVTGNTCQGNFYCGISVEYSDNNTVTGNTCQENTDHGILIYDSCPNNTVTGNNCEGNGASGIIIDSTTGITVTGNNCQGNANEGIFVTVSNLCTVVGNTCHGHGDCGIYLNGSDYNSITGNTCQLNAYAGIEFYESDNNVTVGNTCLENSQTTDNTYPNIWLIDSDYNLIEANLCRQGAQANQPDYGIDIDGVGNNNNVVKHNDLYDGGKTAPFNDTGTDTELDSVTVPFSDGTEPLDSGYLIDVGGEFARAWLFLNKEVTQVVRIKVYARAVPAEADKMRAEFVIYGASDNQVYTIVDGSVADHPSTSSNFGADDVIYWTITEAGVLALLGGDSVEVKVLHEAVGDGDIDTQAYFRTVTIEYV